ncbi:hypothetical protein ABMA77_13640 [Halobacteriovorax sp. RZ-1]|uniref:hypothetical protein n=1 Tax=unclassified Halobacteriovorax TaxID=2639665 RepID=UPI00371F9E1B
MLLKSTFFVLSLCVSIQTLAAIKLNSGRGDISLISKNQSRQIDATKITSDINLSQDTLIITEDNSYARLSNERGDLLIIGPNSKVTIELINAPEGDFVSLHAGIIRLKVKKQRKVRDSRFDRIFVRTNSALVGLEDTDSLVLYNIYNNVTGTLTFTGKANMKRINRSHKFSAGERLVFRRSLNEQKIKFKFRTNNEIRNFSKEINDVLFGEKLKDVATVARGQYSATFHESRPVSMPVKLNPLQLSKLYPNNRLDMTVYSEDTDSEEINLSPYPLTDNLFKPAEQRSSYRGQYSSSQKRYAPKAGGLVDLVSGIYIPPEKNATFNENYRVYEAREIGRINSSNGNFISPKNLTLDPNRGFLVVNNTHESIQKQSELNDLLKSNLLLASYKSVSGKKMTTAERFSSNIVGLSLVNQGHTFGYDSGDYELGKRGIELSLALMGNGSFRPFAKFRLLNENFASSSLSNNIERFYQMNLGVDYQFGSIFYVSGQLSIDEEPIVLNATSSIVSATLTNFIGEFGVKVLNLKKLDLFAKAGAKYSLANADDGFDIESGMGLYFGGKLDYWLNRYSFVFAELEYLTHSFSISGGGNDSDVDMSGAMINFGYRYSF